MPGLAAVRYPLWIGFPFLVYLGLERVEPRYLGLCLLALLIARNRRTASVLWQGMAGAAAVGAVMAGVWVAVLYINNDERLLRLYPAAVSLGILVLFGYSLWHPPSMIERFARLREPQLPDAGVAYTRRVTWVWCAFLAANGMIAAYTALYASRAMWALYNGFVAYLLIGGMLGGEWLYRRSRHRGEAT